MYLSGFRIVWKKSFAPEFLGVGVFDFRISFEQLLQPHGCSLCFLKGCSELLVLLYLMIFTFFNTLEG